MLGPENYGIRVLRIPRSGKRLALRLDSLLADAEGEREFFDATVLAPHNPGKGIYPFSFLELFARYGEIQIAIR